MSIESIKVPDLGGASAVEVIEICVAVGDIIAKDDSLVVLESDKASMEVPSPKAGKVTDIKVSDGDSVTEGDLILELEVSGDAGGETEDTEKESAEPEALESESTDAAPSDVDATTSAAETTAVAKTAPVNVPDLGGPDNVDVIEVCVAPGDEISEGDSLVVLESDKASMEVPSPRSGKVISVALANGDKVSSGAEILQLESRQTAEAAKPAPEPAAAAQPQAPEPPAEKPAQAPTPAPVERSTPEAAQKRAGSGSGVYAGPAVRKLAREMGIELEAVTASGPRGRITKDDLKVFVKKELTSPSRAAAGSAIPEVPEIDFGAFGEVEIESLNKVQKTIRDNMHRSWLNVPHVTQFDDADITELEEFRQSLKAESERRGVKLTPVPFLIKACAAALKANPKFNASLHADGESIVYKKYIHIGMAVDTPVGLMVPVIRDVDKKNIWELAAESSELAQKAKDRKLKPMEMQGGCFSISSLGNIGGQGFTPIVNTPEVGILAVSKLTVKPVWNGSEFVPRKMLPLSLSYDHRAINGADAGRFFTYLNEVLADIRRLLL